MKKNNIGHLRKSYGKKELNDNLDYKSPFSLFKLWFDEAAKDERIEEVNAMTLSTISEDGFPRSRVVLLKEYSLDGFIFYTNYNSMKGRSISINPKVCLKFFWPSLEKQIILKGHASKVSKKKSNEYFDSRPEGSKIGAIVSPQSEKILNRDFLEGRILKYMDKKNKLKRPDYWGGYIVKVISFEFWQGRPNRLHDRILFEIYKNKWNKYRLAP